MPDLDPQPFEMVTAPSRTGTATRHDRHPGLDPGHLPRLRKSDATPVVVYCLFQRELPVDLPHQCEPNRLLAPIEARVTFDWIQQPDFFIYAGGKQGDYGVGVLWP